MPQLLPLSRAARLAGVTRSELQKKLRDQNIEAFEGKITVSNLLAMYPDADLESDPVFERIQDIKDNARPKRDYTDGWLPDAEVLMTRLKEINSVLMRTKASLNYTEQVLKDILQRLAAGSQLATDRRLEAVDELHDWLAHSLSAGAYHHDARAALFARDAFLKVLAPSVRILSTGHEFFVEGRDSLLEAGLKAGLHLQYGCSSGNCGSCKARLVSGKAKQIRDHDYVLSARERESGYILSCSWTAVTDLVLEAIEAKTPGICPRSRFARASTGLSGSATTSHCSSSSRHVPTPCASWPGSGSRWATRTATACSCRSRHARATGATSSSSSGADHRTASRRPCSTAASPRRPSTSRALMASSCCARMRPPPSCSWRWVTASPR